MTRDEVLKEYEYTRIDNNLIAWENEPYTAWHTDAMADEIVRLREQLATVTKERDAALRDWLLCAEANTKYQKQAERWQVLVEVAELERRRDHFCAEGGE